MVKWFVKSIHRVDSRKTTNQCLNKLIPSGVWEEIEETQSSVEIQVFDRRNVCMSPLLYRKRTQPSEFLYLAILRELLVVFSRAAQTIAWIWMSRRAHPSFYFLRCNWKRSHVCQKLCLDNTVHPLVPSCTFSPFKYISFERILKINFLPSWNAQVNRYRICWNSYFSISICYLSDDKSKRLIRLICVYSCLFLRCTSLKISHFPENRSICWKFHQIIKSFPKEFDSIIVEEKVNRQLLNG